MKIVKLQFQKIRTAPKRTLHYKCNAHIHATIFTLTTYDATIIIDATVSICLLSHKTLKAILCP